MVRYKYRKSEGESAESIDKAYKRLKVEYAIYRSMCHADELVNSYKNKTLKKVSSLRCLFLLGLPLTQAPAYRDEVFLFIFSLITELNKLHAQGYVHRDLTIDNVIRSSRTDSYKLIDFGATTCSNPEFSLLDKDDCVTTYASLSINEWIYRLKTGDEYCFDQFLPQSYSQTDTCYGLLHLFAFFPQLKVNCQYFANGSFLTEREICLTWNYIIEEFDIINKSQDRSSITERQQAEHQDWYDKLDSLLLHVRRISSDSKDSWSTLAISTTTRIISESKCMLRKYYSKVLSVEAVKTKGISLCRSPTALDDVYALGTILFSSYSGLCAKDGENEDVLKILGMLIGSFTHPNFSFRLPLQPLQSLTHHFNYERVEALINDHQKNRLAV